MKKVWKIIGLAAALLLAGFVFWIYSSFYGNAVEAWLARRTMERYLAQTYPARQFRWQSIRYDFKFHRYEAKFIEGSDHAFELSGTWRKVAYDEYRYTYAMDQTLSARFTEQLESGLEALLMKQFPQLHAVYASVYVPVDTLPADAQYHKGMEQDTDLEIALIGEDVPAEEFAAQCLQIRDAILQAGYNPISMRILLNAPEDMEGKGGMLLYTLTIPRKDYSANLPALLARVDSYNQRHRGK